MRDYEHMLVALDEVISHDVAGIICMENYKDCYLPRGFRKVFDLFCEYWEDYESNKDKYQNEETKEMEFIKFQASCRIRKEEHLKKFVDELRDIEPAINYEAEIERYQECIEQEDTQTQEMYLSLYPLLISLIRKKEEEVEKV